MESLLGYNDSMDLSDGEGGSQNRMDIDQDVTAIMDPSVQEDDENDTFFRTNSLFFATFPWFSILPIIPTKLSSQLGDSPSRHFAYVSHWFVVQKDKANILNPFIANDNGF